MESKEGAPDMEDSVDQAKRERGISTLCLIEMVIRFITKHELLGDALPKFKEHPLTRPF